MYLGFYEESDRCPEGGCNGNFEYIREKSCSCHINPPCSACVDAPLTCNKCGHIPDEPPYKDVPVHPGIAMREYKPRPLDKTKIDYRSKMHTGSSMIKEGIYPDDTTQKEVEAVVKGTFGGRFTRFGNGQFTYIAYTD
jgi:hypothetical protein